MREDRKSRLGVIAIALALFLFSILLVTNLSAFTEPIGPQISFVTGNAPQPNPRTTDGLLLVTAAANLTVLGSGSTGLGGNGGFVNEPLKGVYISITNAETNSSAVENSTDANGQLAIYLPPSNYEVSFLDWRFNYSTVSVKIYQGQVTHLGSYLNATMYPIQSLNIADPDSSGMALTSQEIYANLGGAQHLGAGGGTYLETGTLPLSEYVTSGTTASLTPVSISAAMSDQNTEWVTMQVTSSIAISSIHQPRLLSLTATYLVGTV